MDPTARPSAAEAAELLARYVAIVQAQRADEAPRGAGPQRPAAGGSATLDLHLSGTGRKDLGRLKPRTTEAYLKLAAMAMDEPEPVY